MGWVLGGSVRVVLITYQCHVRQASRVPGSAYRDYFISPSRSINFAWLLNTLDVWSAIYIECGEFDPVPTALRRGRLQKHFAQSDLSTLVDEQVSADRDFSSWLC